MKLDVGTWLLTELTLERYGFELCESAYTQICLLVCLVVKTTVLHDLWLAESMNRTANTERGIASMDEPRIRAEPWIFNCVEGRSL